MYIGKVQYTCNFQIPLQVCFLFLAINITERTTCNEVETEKQKKIPLKISFVLKPLNKCEVFSKPAAEALNT